MKIEEIKIGLIQDDELYQRIVRLDFKSAAVLEIAPTRNSGLKLLDRLAKGLIVLDLLGLDENLTATDHSGSDGKILYERFQVLGLDTKVRLVDISTTPTLPIERIGGFAIALKKFVESM